MNHPHGGSNMAEIRPRWEWRSFGQRFGPAEAQIAKLSASAVQDSDELYLLSGAGANVKIRDALMDIKVLRELNADGLEQWTPVMKAAFPLPAAELARVLQALGLPLPSSPESALPDGLTQDAFIARFAAPGSPVRAVPVHKRRVRYTIGGCTSELSEVVADGRATRTLAVESEDAAAVIAAVRGLGLGDYLNTSYPKGLAALIDGTPGRVAVIDAGTNSIKFIVAERDAARGWRTLVDRAEMTRLGEGLAPGGNILDSACERAAAAVADMADEARRHGVRAIAAVGTAGLRMAANGAQVVAAIRARSGVAIDIISGDEEARLAFVAARAGLGLDRGSMVIFDTGGGSSQFTFGHDSSVDERFSVDVGAVRYTERFGLDRVVADDTLRAALAAIAVDLSRLDGRSPPDALAAMGGAVTNLAAVRHGLARYDPDIVQGTVLDRAEIDRQIELYRTQDADARRRIVGLQPKRAEVILAGACIVRTVMDKLGKSQLTVSDRGLRHGVLAERFAD
jgi:exopolyphosphatase/guanosine-5'-triphosphate,3'-diphosphate pyrophosphatase